MSVQFNDMIATIKRNGNGFVIISGCKTAICNNKVAKIKDKYYIYVIQKVFLSTVYLSIQLKIIPHSNVPSSSLNFILTSPPYFLTIRRILFVPMP